MPKSGPRFPEVPPTEALVPAPPPPSVEVSDEVMLGLRSSWIMLRRDTRLTDEYIENQIEDMQGLPRGQMRRWREDRAPDGRDWYQLAEMMTGKLAQQFMIENLSMRSAAEGRRQQKILAQLMIHSAISGLVGEPLYDAPPPTASKPEAPRPKEIQFAYNAKGHKVPLSGIRPQTARDAALMLGVAHKALDGIEQAERDETMTSEERMRETAKMLADIASYLGFTPEQVDKLRGIEMTGVVPEGLPTEKGEDGASGEDAC